MPGERINVFCAARRSANTIVDVAAEKVKFNYNRRAVERIQHVELKNVV